MMRLALASNEPRSRFLFAELRELADVVTAVNFDQIDPMTRVAARLATLRPNRRQWYQAYQMHALVQRRRRAVLLRGLATASPADALLMWGSWFNPDVPAGTLGAPFYNYIDQSLALVPALGEPPAAAFGRRRAHALQADTYSQSAGILCMSEWAREQTLLAHRVDPAKLHVIGWGPCGVDLSGEDVPWGRREKLVIHVSNDYRRKGVDFLLEVARRFRTIDPEVRFVVIGRDASGMPVQNSENVEFTGQISDRQRLTDYFRRACAFFLPFRFDRSPHVLVEAMSAGLPFVASAQGGAVELTAADRVGFTIEIGDLDGYTAALAALIRDFDFAEDCGRRGRRLVLERYNWRAVALSALQIMERRVGRPDHGRAALDAGVEAKG